MNNTIFIINTVSPIFLIVAIGWILRKRNIINESFIKQSTNFVFKITIPVLVFIKLESVDFKELFDSNIIILIYSGMLFTFFLAWTISILLIKKGTGRGVFIQGSFWPNNVILGLALVINIFGEIAVSKMIMVLVFLLPLQYTLSVIALTVSDNTEKRSRAVARMIKSIITNPIIISAILAIIFSLINIKLPRVLFNTGNYLAAITLPLALIGLGGSLRIKQLQSLSIITIGSSILKLLISPIIATTVGYFVGYRGADLGVIYIIFSSPTAVVSYIIADSMTPHGKLAGNIVLITTLLSAITIPLGLIILNQLLLI